MNKQLIRYTLIVIAAAAIAVILNYALIGDYNATDTNVTLQTLLSPMNFIVIALLGCLAHWHYIGKKVARPVQSLPAKSLGVVATSAMIGLILGTVSYLGLVVSAADHEPIFGLFIFVLPLISLLSAGAGAIIGIVVIYVKVRKKLR